MTLKRLLCGWVEFHDCDRADDALEIMLDAEGLGRRDVQTLHVVGGEIALSNGAGSLATDDSNSRVAMVIGRPRWTNASMPHEADGRNDACILLERYAARGEEVIAEMAGDFALFLFDPRDGRAVLAIDRTGTERLCFARTGNTLVFSTSARMVARHPAINASIRHQAIFEYLYCHMVPSPDTIFSGVEKVLPAQQVVATPQRLVRDFYWALSYSPGNAAIEAEQTATFKRCLRQGVERLVDGRAVGAFLSGGTDSSTVAGLLGQVLGRPAPTFSIGFEAEDFDEMEYARITARHFGTKSHEFYVTPDHVAEAIPMIARAFDEPFGNASAVPTYFCAKLAKECGIEVMLAGDGGDEFFGGNARYAKQKVFEHFWKLPGWTRQLLQSALTPLPPDTGPALLRKARSYVNQARIPLPDRLETYNFLHREPLTEIFEPNFLANIDTGRPLELMRDAYRRCGSPELVDKMMHLDHKFTLADNDLRKVKVMCELAGVDVRFPLLDEGLIAFSGTLKGAQKVSGKHLRVFFKSALHDFLPEATITKSKHGFGLPFGLWLSQDGPLRDLASSALNRLATRGIVRPSYLDKLWLQHRREHASYYGVMIWVLVQLELWLQNNATR